MPKCIGRYKNEKRQKRRIWAKDQKLVIIGKHLNEHISVRTLEKEYIANRLQLEFRR